MTYTVYVNDIRQRAFATLLEALAWAQDAGPPGHYVIWTTDGIAASGIKEGA
jgi:hypothetical protein